MSENTRVRFGTTRLIVRLDLEASPRAALFGVKLYFLTTAITQSRVAWLMRGWLLSTSETVLSEKPLSLAISLIVLRFVVIEIVPFKVAAHGE